MSNTTSATTYEEFSARCIRLNIVLTPLQDRFTRWSAATFQPLSIVPPLPTQEFLEICATLCEDLALTANPILRVGIAGGTQVGKSTLFDYIVGERLAGVSEQAAATRWPLALLPDGLAKDLTPFVQRLFPLFEPKSWRLNYDSEVAKAKPPIFYRVDKKKVLPSHLVLVDTPDVDSVEAANPETARRAAKNVDLVIYVTTDQKYKDQKPTTFMRDSVAGLGRTSVLVINKLPPYDINDVAAIDSYRDEVAALTRLNFLHFYVAESTKAARLDPLALSAVRWAAGTAGPQTLRDDLHDVRTAKTIRQQAVTGMLERFDRHFTDLCLRLAAARAEIVSARDVIAGILRAPDLRINPAPTGIVFAEFGRWARKRDLLAGFSLLSLQFFDGLGDWMLLRRWRKKDAQSLIGAWGREVEDSVASYLTLVHARLGEARSEARSEATTVAACEAVHKSFQQVRMSVTTRVKAELLGLEEPDGTGAQPTLRESFARSFHTLLDELYNSDAHRAEIDSVIFWIKAYSYTRPALTLGMVVLGGVGLEHVIAEAAKQSAIAVAKEAAFKTLEAGMTEAGKAAIIEAAAVEAAKQAALSAGQIFITGAAGGAGGGAAAAYTGEGWRAVVVWLISGGLAALSASTLGVVYSILESSKPVVDTRKALESMERELEGREAAIGPVRASLDQVFGKEPA